LPFLHAETNIGATGETTVAANGRTDMDDDPPSISDQLDEHTTVDKPLDLAAMEEAPTKLASNPPKHTPSEDTAPTEVAERGRK
jgi:hypothetical protein